jgi:LmbE family N-acetylglucosaminyl deacetylase
MSQNPDICQPPGFGYNQAMRWVYLSPHLDDVALSCGGLLWEQAQAGKSVEVWSICAGAPPDEQFSPFAQDLHHRWQTGNQAVHQRRLEDQASCARLGASAVYFNLPDCIYRRSPRTGAWLYHNEQDLTGAVHPDEAPRMEQLAGEIQTMLPPEHTLVCPLTLGGHVDHRLTRMVAESFNIPRWYYADYPYVLKTKETLRTLEADGWKSVLFLISEEGLEAWMQSIAAHRSQISTFWPNLEAMYQAIRAYMDEMGGVQLWQAPR